eukprot:15473629-Alexandrium_andersonii.AAC.1
MSIRFAGASTTSAVIHGSARRWPFNTRRNCQITRHTPRADAPRARSVTMAGTISLLSTEPLYACQ